MTQISSPMDHHAARVALKSSSPLGGPNGGGKTDKIGDVLAHKSQKIEKMEGLQHSKEIKEVRFEKADRHAMNTLKETLQANHGAMLEKMQKHDAVTQYRSNAPSEDTSPRDIIKNVLVSVGQKLGAASASGEGVEALEGILSNALQGFESGMDEAKAQLKSLGIMNPEVKADLQKVMNGVMTGLGKLEDKYLGTEGTSDYTLPGGPSEEEYTLPVEIDEDPEQNLV